MALPDHPPKPKRGLFTEQLNIEGKRSGEGFVTHKAGLVDALVRANAERINIGELAIGRKGLLGYLKAMGGSNVIKVVPANGGAGDKQADSKRLKVVCGSLTSYLDNGEWIGEKTPMTYADLRVSPRNIVKPNLGAVELAQAIARVSPFIASDENRPVLACINIEAGEGKLTFVCADGYSLAVNSLDYDDCEGVAVIPAADLKSALTAIRRAMRAKLSIGETEDNGSGKNLILETELIRYRWPSADYNFPNWRKLLPEGGAFQAHFDTTELLTAVRTLQALNGGDTYYLDLTVGDGMLKVATVDGDGVVELPADTEGDTTEVRLDGRYLVKICRAFAGMVDMTINTPSTPLNFQSNGFRVVLMPVMKEGDKAKQATTAEAEAEAIEQPEAHQPETKPKQKGKGKGKGKASTSTKPTAEPTAEAEAEPTAEAEKTEAEAVPVA